MPVFPTIGLLGYFRCKHCRPHNSFTLPSKTAAPPGPKNGRQQGKQAASRIAGCPCATRIAPARTACPARFREAPMNEDLSRALVQATQLLGEKPQIAEIWAREI